MKQVALIHTWLFVVAALLPACDRAQDASSSASIELAISSSATTLDLYNALHPTDGAAKAAIAQATLTAGAMSFAQLYDHLAAQATNQSAALDGHIVSGGLARLTANRDAILALGSQYATVKDWWAHEHNDPMSVSAAALAADVAAVAHNIEATSPSSLDLLSVAKRKSLSASALKYGTSADPAAGWQKCADSAEFASNVGLIVAGVCTPLMFVPNELVRTLVKWPCVTWDSVSAATWSASSACQTVHDIINPDDGDA